MKQPVVPEEPRMPTSTWSGSGLSKSQPAHITNHMIKEEKVGQGFKLCVASFTFYNAKFDYCFYSCRTLSMTGAIGAEFSTCLRIK